MDLKTFYDFYNLEEILIEHIYQHDNKLYMILDLNVYIELMANGCRPVIDMDMRHLFIFDDFNKKIDYKNIYAKNYQFKNNNLQFTLNGELVTIKSKNITIIENYK